MAFERAEGINAGKMAFPAPGRLTDPVPAGGIAFLPNSFGQANGECKKTAESPGVLRVPGLSAYGSDSAHGGNHDSDPVLPLSDARCTQIFHRGAAVI